MKPSIQPLRDGDPKNFQGWVLQGLIGEGGQSTIYLAEKNGQQAALKMIRKEYLHDSKSVDRFYTEIKYLEMLDHPNIARVLEVEDSGSYVAIEFIDGPNLEDYIEQIGPLDIRTWWKYAQSLATTIEYCHSRGIIHKDISPRNLVVGHEGLVLIDFGISYLEKDPRLTSLEETVGTPPFMSPEHFGNTRPKEMDNFSLAGTLIFAGTGHYPFKGESSAEWKESIQFSKPDFSGLIEDQIQVLSPLLYKKLDDRGSLSIFSKLLDEIISGNSQSHFVRQEFSKVKSESGKSLVQQKKKPGRSGQQKNRILFAVSLVTLLSIGIVSFGINSIQNSSSDGAVNSSAGFNEVERLSDPNLSPSESLVPGEQNSLGEAAVVMNNSPINKVIQTNLDLAKKFYESNELDRALLYAKLAASAGNAQGMYRVAYILTAQGKPQEAIDWYEKSANLGFGDAYWNLGALYERLGKAETALTWYEKGALNKNIGSLNALGFYYAEKNGDYLKALPYYTRSAALGSVMGMSNLGFVYEEMNDKANAKKWYTKASNLGSVDASVNLGFMYEQAADWTNARKYYKRAADKKDPLGMFNLATVLADQFGQINQSCVLLKEAILIDSIEADTKKFANTEIAKNCSNAITARPSPASSAKASDGELQPVGTYKSSEYSEKTESNVQTYSIFGRAFLKDGDWIIPLTNAANESVPPINRVQFRDSSLPFGSWWNMPYKLVDGGEVGWQAVVSNLGIQIGHSQIGTGKKVCPEFRFALVQNGLVTHIWNKSVEPCLVP